MQIQLFDPTWLALARETGMAGRLVASGLGALRRASSAEVALYYEAFFGITVGLERICKLTIVVSDRVYRGTFPTDAEMKKKYGHDLSRLVREVRSRVDAGEVSTKWSIPADTDKEFSDLLDFVTEFAKHNRYYNLAYLAGGNPSSSEPVKSWVDLVLRHHPQKAKMTPSQVRDVAMAKEMDRVFGDMILIRAVDEGGTPLSDLETSAMHGHVTEHVQRQGTMMCARLARSLAGALGSLSYSGTDQLPVFTEFFPVLLNDDEYLRTRKTFV